MAEQTNPATPGVEQSETDVVSRMANFLEDYDKKPPEIPLEQQKSEPEEQEAKPEGQADSAELTPDDIPDENATPQPVVETEFEIVHNGTQKKLSREETIRLAQQGFDYTQKTQALADQARQIQASLQRAQEIEQVFPILMQEAAEVQALQAQLKQYENVDWVNLAVNNPLEYPRYRAQFDVLKQSYDAASGNLNAKASAVNQARKQLTAQQLQQEFPKLTEAIPAWKDPAKYQAGAEELGNWLIAKGADPERVRGLSSSLEVEIAWKALQYDKLVKAKTGKVKQLREAPPVTRPNASQGQAGINQDTQRKLGERLRKSGDTRDAAALLLDRWK